jgi:hypothetical protein
MGALKTHEEKLFQNLRGKATGCPAHHHQSDTRGCGLHSLSAQARVTIHYGGGHNQASE